MVQYSNGLICILMNIKENLRNERKRRKLRGVPTKLPLFRLLMSLNTLFGVLNLCLYITSCCVRLICKPANLHIHKY